MKNCSNEQTIKDFIGILKCLHTDSNFEELKNYFEEQANLLSSMSYVSSIKNDVQIFMNYDGEKKHSQDKRILDFGCGTGIVSTILGAYSEQIYAVDYLGERIDGWSKDILNNVYSLIWKQVSEKHKINFSFYERFPLSFPNEHFDVIIMYAVLEHIDNDTLIKNVFAEISRLIKPNGILCIGKLPRVWSVHEKIAKMLNMGAHEKLFKRKEALYVLEKHGFIVKQIDNTDLLFQQPAKVMNVFYPMSKYIERFSSVPLVNMFAHNFRIIAQKNNKY